MKTPGFSGYQLLGLQDFPARERRSWASWMPSGIPKG